MTPIGIKAGKQVEKEKVMEIIDKIYIEEFGNDYSEKVCDLNGKFNALKKIRDEIKKL